MGWVGCTFRLYLRPLQSSNRSFLLLVILSTFLQSKEMRNGTMIPVFPSFMAAIILGLIPTLIFGAAGFYGFLIAIAWVTIAFVYCFVTGHESGRTGSCMKKFVFFPFYALKFLAKGIWRLAKGLFRLTRKAVGGRGPVEVPEVPSEATKVDVGQGEDS